MRHCTLTLAAVLLMAAIPAWALQKGEVAPSFALTSTEGQVVSLADLSGRVVAIAFWATWGKHCEEQMKQLQELSREFGDRGLVVLAVNEREERSKAAAFAERIGVSYRVLLDEGKTAKAYGVNGIPDLWVIDHKGIARERFIGYGPTLPKAIRDAIAAQVTRPVAAPESAKPATGEASSAIPVSLRAYAHLQLGAAHLNVGDAFVKAGYRDRGHFNEALRELRSGLALDPKNVDLHIWMGLALERKSDSAGAIREYQTALDLEPGNVYAQDSLRRLAVPPPSTPEQPAQEEEQTEQ